MLVLDARKRWTRPQNTEEIKFRSGVYHRIPESEGVLVDDMKYMPASEQQIHEKLLGVEGLDAVDQHALRYIAQYAGGEGWVPVEDYEQKLRNLHNVPDRRKDGEWERQWVNGTRLWEIAKRVQDRYQGRPPMPSRGQHEAEADARIKAVRAQEKVATGRDRESIAARRAQQEAAEQTRREEKEKLLAMKRTHEESGQAEQSKRYKNAHEGEQGAVVGLDEAFFRAHRKRKAGGKRKLHPAMRPHTEFMRAFKRPGKKEEVRRWWTQTKGRAWPKLR